MIREPNKKSKEELLREIYEKFPNAFDTEDFDTFKEAANKLDARTLESLLEGLRRPSSTFGSGSPSSSASSPIEAGRGAYFGSGPPSSGASSPVGSGSSSSGSSCFIATAAFGSSLEGEVVALSRFRDRFLLGNRAGRVLVGVYYRYGPSFAALIRKHNSLKAVVRMALFPMVNLCKRLKY